jgi:nicotinamide-nucleotide amidase
MHAEIIAIGTELTTGAKLDTNSQWLSQELSAIGIPVHFHVTVGDNLEENIDVFQSAARRSDIVLITGGLGPTLDDLTRDVLARLTGTPLVLHEPSLEVIRSMFARRNREMPQRNVVQAMFPEGSVPIPNRRGTAPGIYVELPRPSGGLCRIAAMPGVPSEMKVMFRDDVLPRLTSACGMGRVIRHAKVHCFGLGESAAEELLGDLTARNRDPEVGITVHEATITLRIVAVAASVDEALAKIASTKALIYQRMGHYAYGEEDDELEHVVVRMLNEKNLSLAVVESGTGGLLSHRLTEVRGHQQCFRAGLVLPNDAAKTTVLEIADDTLRTAGAVSAMVAQEMALACRRRFHSDLALSVTECSRSDFAETDATAPTAFIGLADTSGADVRELNLAGDPAIIKSRVVKSVLNLLRLRLMSVR